MNFDAVKKWSEEKVKWQNHKEVNKSEMIDKRKVKWTKGEMINIIK